MQGKYAFLKALFTFVANVYYIAHSVHQISLGQVKNTQSKSQGKVTTIECPSSKNPGKALQLSQLPPGLYTPVVMIFIPNYTHSSEMCIGSSS